MGYFAPMLLLALIAAVSADTVPLTVLVQDPAHSAVLTEVEQPSPVIRPRRDPQLGGSQSSAAAQSGSFGFGPFQGSFASSQASSASSGGGGFGGGRPGYGRPGYGHGRPGYGHGHGGGHHGHGGGHYHGHGGGHHGGGGGHYHGGGFHRRGFF